MAINTLCRTFKYFRYTQVIPCHLELFSVKYQKLKHYITPQWINYNQNFCSNVSNVPGIEDPVNQKKKKPFIPRITLLFDNNDLTVTTLEQAEKLANRRNMKLIKIVDFDVKTERPIYKLMSIKDFIKEDNLSKAAAKVQKERSLKEDKTITLSSRIANHDLEVKIKSMHKMLKRKHGIRVIISIDNNHEKAEFVRNEIMKACPEHGKIISNSATSSSFQIILRPDLDKLLNKTDAQEKTEENAG
ncbi:uncharacterized protein mIF3 [Chelonus insularis]|uniref:uncharacterized protein mIF3 n=1 Tax=Chelonus insularis TaxID=460826 RepID=UPI0015892ADA|nr:uncharacterized protein LOC118065713 [Chelonus insularis]